MVNKKKINLKSFRLDKDELFENLKLTLTNRRFWMTNFALLVGNLLVAYATNTVLIKLSLVPPGFTGISIILYYIFPYLSVSIYYTILNIPLIIISWRVISARFVINSVLGIFYFIISLEVTKSLTVPLSIVDNEYLMVFLGALAAGIGTGFYLRFGAAGGSDMVAFIMRKKVGISISTTLLMINIGNLVINFFVQDIKTTLLSAVYHILMLGIANKVQIGFSQRSAVFIISRHYREISAKLNQKLERSSTFLKIVGSYSNQEGYMVYTIVNLFEIGRLKEIVHDIDHDALVSIMSTAEVVGQKFVAWEDSGYFKKSAKKKLNNL